MQRKMKRPLLLLALLHFCGAALSPGEILYYRLGVPVGSPRMERLKRTLVRSWKDTSVFEDMPLLDRRVAALENAFGPEATRIIVLRAPLTLVSDLDITLAPRIDALTALQV